MINEDKFEFVGNQLTLDFINTQIARSGETRELLSSFGDLVVWCVKAEIFDDKTATEILSKWKNKPEAEASLEKALAFRSELRGTILQIIRLKKIPARIIDSINDILRTQTGYFEIERANGKFSKRRRFKFDEPRDLLVPLADSASDFLCFADFELVKKCEDAGCVRFFYDTTKNHSRRWCSMISCGNRAKATNYYERKKARNKRENLKS